MSEAVMPGRSEMHALTRLGYKILVLRLRFCCFAPLIPAPIVRVARGAWAPTLVFTLLRYLTAGVKVGRHSVGLAGTEYRLMPSVHQRAGW